MSMKCLPESSYLKFNVNVLVLIGRQNKAS